MVNSKKSGAGRWPGLLVPYLVLRVSWKIGISMIRCKIYDQIRSCGTDRDSEVVVHYRNRPFSGISVRGHIAPYEKNWSELKIGPGRGPGLLGLIWGWAVAKELLNFCTKSQTEGLAIELPAKQKICTLPTVPVGRWIAGGRDRKN